jgi:hypothetical protein
VPLSIFFVKRIKPDLALNISRQCKEQSCLFRELFSYQILYIMGPDINLLLSLLTGYFIDFSRDVVG